MSARPSLDAVKQQFAHWRAMPDKSYQIPNHLWEQVMPLLAHYKVSKILSTLGLSSSQLKTYRQKNHGDVNKPSKENKPSHSFVSISLQDSVTDNTEVAFLELIRPDGVMLRFKKIDHATLSTLLQSFLGK